MPVNQQRICTCTIPMLAPLTTTTHTRHNHHPLLLLLLQVV
jgi:hypothetical protein